MHSAAWDAEYDLTGKTVAVIGGGSSAVQIIPSIQPRVKKLIPYLRSPVWITAGFGAKYAAPGGENFKCESLEARCRVFLTYWRLQIPKSRKKYSRMIQRSWTGIAGMWKES